MKIVNIKNCSHCGKNHRNIKVKKIDKLVLANYYGICPEKKEPIFVKVSK